VKNRRHWNMWWDVMNRQEQTESGRVWRSWRDRGHVSKQNLTVSFKLRLVKERLAQHKEKNTNGVRFMCVRFSLEKLKDDTIDRTCCLVIEHVTLHTNTRGHVKVNTTRPCQRFFLYPWDNVQDWRKYTFLQFI
jgi:hypothetical protein